MRRTERNLRDSMRKETFTQRNVQETLIVFVQKVSWDKIMKLLLISVSLFINHFKMNRRCFQGWKWSSKCFKRAPKCFRITWSFWSSVLNSESSSARLRLNWLKSPLHAIPSYSRRYLGDFKLNRRWIIEELTMIALFILSAPNNES